MKVRTVLISLIFLLILAACGQREQKPAHTHAWEPANCARGEFCFSCGETRGEALTHSWAPVTCAKPKHCTLCGKSEGNVIPHTTNGYGVCTLCGNDSCSVISLDALDQESTHIAYDGVIVRMRFDQHNPESSGYPKNFEIYDQDDTLVAQGSWPQMYFVFVSADANTQCAYLDAPFVPLAPGTYLIKYHMYDRSETITQDEKGNPLHKSQWYVIPDGSLLSRVCPIIVR